MIDPLSLGAALLLGLAASGHCLLMCGGISAALGLATARGAGSGPRPLLLVGYQLGRITSYSLAGLLLAAALGSAVAVLDSESVRRSLRIVSALVLLLAALVAFGYLRDPGAGFGRRLWARVAPLGRRLLPVTTLPRALAFGMVWGWMPCGFVYTVLLIATLQLDPLRGASVMAAFGLGTLPALLAASFGAPRISALAGGRRGRQLAGGMLLVSAVLTAASPWLLHRMPGLHGWLPFDCSVPASAPAITP